MQDAAYSLQIASYSQASQCWECNPPRIAHQQLGPCDRGLRAIHLQRVVSSAMQILKRLKLGSINTYREIVRNYHLSQWFQFCGQCAIYPPQLCSVLLYTCFLDFYRAILSCGVVQLQCYNKVKEYCILLKGHFFHTQSHVAAGWEQSKVASCGIKSSITHVPSFPFIHLQNNLNVFLGGELIWNSLPIKKLIAQAAGVSDKLLFACKPREIKSPPTSSLH